MFVANNRASFHLWWKKNLVKHQNVSKYYENDCSILIELGKITFVLQYVQIVIVTNPVFMYDLSGKIPHFTCSCYKILRKSDLNFLSMLNTVCIQIRENFVGCTCCESRVFGIFVYCCFGELAVFNFPKCFRQW